MGTTTLTLIREYQDWDEETAQEEFDLVVDYRWTPGSPARTPRGELAPTEPPEPGEAEIESLIDQYGQEWTLAQLTDGERERLEETIQLKEEG